MKINELTKTLRNSDWTVSKDEVGDRIGTYDLNDRVICVIHNLRKTQSLQKLGVVCTVSTRRFQEVCSIIDPGIGDFSPLLLCSSDLSIKAELILESHVQEMSSNVIAWAKEQDLEEALQAYVDLPTSAPGAQSIWHMSALAISGNVEQLISYQQSFEARDRLGFANYITKGHIDRAISLVEK